MISGGGYLCVAALLFGPLGCQPSSSTLTDSLSEPTDPEPPWPQWALEHWVWEDESTQDSVMALVDGYLQRDIAVGAVIIDSPWATGYSTFEWDLELFPDPQRMIDDLHDRGVRVMLWTVPGINVDVQPLYDEAEAAGYFMADPGSKRTAVVEWWKGDGSLIDYWNEDAVAWWHSKVDQTLAYGIDGWKCDGLDFSALIASYSPAAGRRIDRLEYSHLYYRDFFDHTRAVLGDDRLVSARPIDNYGIDVGGDLVAFAPKDINWAAWVGDQDATFDGLKAALLNFRHSADYGYTVYGSDIGGYREDDTYPQGRSKEVLLRWTGLGAFNPVMENGGGGRHEPWAFDEETVDIYRSFVDTHHALLPYLMREGAVAFEAERSLMTFLDLERYTYLLGPDVYVAPVLEDGAREWEVAPPEGDWVYLYDPTVQVAGGSTVMLSVPLDAYPVLVRAGSRVASELL